MAEASFSTHSVSGRRLAATGRDEGSKGTSGTYGDYHEG